MLEHFLTVGEKVLILFLMIAVGVVLCKRKMISKRGADQINGILVHVVSPCVIISSFQIDRESVSLWSLGLTAVMATVSFLVAILIVRFFFGVSPRGCAECSSLPPFIPTVVLWACRWCSRCWGTRGSSTPPF